MIQLLVVDDKPRFLTCLCRGLTEFDGDIAVVGMCADGSEVCVAAAALHPDVVLMDMRMPVMSGPDATRALLAVLPAARVLILAGLLTRRALDAARRAGAVGYLLKDGDLECLDRAIRTVAAGLTAWPDEALIYVPALAVV